ncbi:MAG: discoidin domain-containing protein [Elusimicrobia bacterium]|nr:discoidin domain-containing protein [Elusimicrobiota bacterium]
MDGDERTRWAGQAIDPQWLAVDFGETRAFDTVRLVWRWRTGRITWCRCRRTRRTG